MRSGRGIGMENQNLGEESFRLTPALLILTDRYLLSSPLPGKFMAW